MCCYLTRLQKWSTFSFLLRQNWEKPILKCAVVAHGSLVVPLESRQLEDCAWLHSFPSLSLCPRYPRLVFPPTLPIILDVITHYNVTHKGRRPLCLQTDLLWLTLAWGLKKRAKFYWWPTHIATFAFCGKKVGTLFFGKSDKFLANYCFKARKCFLRQLYARTQWFHTQHDKFTINANCNIFLWLLHLFFHLDQDLHK